MQPRPIAETSSPFPSPTQGLDWGNDHHHARIANVLRHIQAHFAEPLDINALADIASMSQSSLHQHFNAVTNASPLQYISSIRLHRAQHLLSDSQLSVSEAAWEAGYQSLSQFSREYKRLFGDVPSRAVGSVVDYQQE